MSDSVAEIRRRWEHVHSGEHHMGCGSGPMACPGFPSADDVGPLLAALDAAVAENVRILEKMGSWARLCERNAALEGEAYAANERIAELEAAHPCAEGEGL